MPKAEAIKKAYIPALKWAVFTPVYDWFVATVLPEHKIRQRLLDQCNLQGGQEILEFGCGTARLCLLIKTHRPLASVTGIDIDPAIPEIARRNVTSAKLDISLVEYDGNKFPLNDESFDTVVVCLVFHHLSDEDKILSLTEISRILKPGGHLHMADWGKAKSPLMRLCYFAVQLVDGFRTTRLNARGGLPDLFRKAGFVHISETAHINTVMGSLCYYQAQKAIFADHYTH